MINPSRFDPIGITGMPFDHARNSACNHLLSSNLEWLFQLDSDVIAPHDAILRLLSHNLPLVSGVYFRRSPPHGQPVIIKNGSWYSNFPRGQLFEADYVGAGCLLMHRDLIARFFQQPQRPGHPVFDWRVNYQGIMPKGECLSEDFTMCRHSKEHWGIKTMIDGSVVCKHVGLAEAGDNSLIPFDHNVHA